MNLYQKVLFCLGEKYRGTTVVIFAMMLVMAALEVICALLFVPFIAILERSDRYLDYGWLVKALEQLGAVANQQSAVLLCCGLLFLAYLTKNAFNLYFQNKKADFVRGAHADLSHRLLKKYLSSDYQFHLGRQSSELIRNINQDIPQIFTNLVTPLLMVMVEGVILVGLMGMLLIKRPLVTLTAIALFGVFGTFFYRYTQRHTYKYGQQLRHASAQLVKWTIQSLGALKETRVLNKEEYFLAQYDASMAPYAAIYSKYTVVRELPRLYIEVLGITTVLIMTMLMLYGGAPDEQTLPTLALFAVAAFRMLPSITRITASLTSVRFNRSSMDDIIVDLQRDTDQVRIEDRPEPLVLRDAIELDELTFRYNEESAPVLDGCSLRIERGQTVAFVGSSGAGKTTLIDLLLGLLTPQGGEIRIDGKPLSESPRAWQRSVGYISQPVYMIDDTVRRNVAFGCHDDEIDDERVWEALRQAQLDELVRSRSEGLDTLIGESGARLSGGQKQRLGIARVLYHDPQVLVFDEATSALDNETEAEISRAIDALSGQKTMILIAHRLDTIRHSDVIFMLGGGRVMDQGTFDELLESSPAFHRLVNAARQIREERPMLADEQGRLEAES